MLPVLYNAGETKEEKQQQVDVRGVQPDRSSRYRRYLRRATTPRTSANTCSLSTCLSKIDRMRSNRKKKKMPNKKPKLTNSNEEGEGYDQFYKSIFSSQAQVGDMEAKVYQQSRAKIDSKWKDYLSEDDEEPRTSQPTMNNALLLNGEITRLKMT